MTRRQDGTGHVSRRDNRFFRFICCLVSLLIGSGQNFSFLVIFIKEKKTFLGMITSE